MPIYTFLTWNLAMMERSEYAPPNWRMDQTEAAIRQTILACDPDFVLFQANARGQSGDIATLARRNLMSDIEAKPAKNAVLTRIKSADLTLANVHLPSSSGGDHDRLHAIETIQETSETRHLAVIGDSNTRTKEEEPIAALDLIGERPPEPTWNGRDGLYRKDARGYTAYFTRAFHSPDIKLSDQKVWSAPTEFKSDRFHLSDHFALSGTLTTP